MTTPRRTVPASTLANALRALAMDAVQRAGSGHPGMPMGMAEIAVALWTRHLRHNPANPAWPDRDRFVLSNGHGSMLLYALLHLTGYDLPLDELRRFRQLDSRTPGHPEFGVTSGVETTTGPLGQGLANAVGMALAEKLLAAEFNRPGYTVIDHRTFVFVGDGCLMEGLSHEAASLAGAWRLSKLVVLYDDDGVSIDGDVAGWYADDTPRRFAACGWNVVPDVDGHDVRAVDAALRTALNNAAADRGPTIVCCKTVIGNGSPAKAGHHSVHGAPLGADEVAATRRALGWSGGLFEIVPDIYAAWDARPRGEAWEAEWHARLRAYRQAHPGPARDLERRLAGELPDDFAARAAHMVDLAARQEAPQATRKASQEAIERLAAAVPELLGGSADLTGSTLTDWPGSGAVRRTPLGMTTGRHIHWGVREFAMAAAMNGIALHGGYRPFGGSFLVFSDYCRSAVRMAALMDLPVIYVFTHDSIGLGEDGPTHQPIEHLASLRLIPNLDVWRPCDATETQVAWNAALWRSHGPTALVLSRQSLPAYAYDAGQRAAMARGGYVHVAEGARPVDLVLLATGSEVSVAVDAAARLALHGLNVRVVSMPCAEVFARQSEDWRRAVLPPLVPVFAIEAGHPAGLVRWTGTLERVIGIEEFGRSAPAGELFARFGITAESVAACVMRHLDPQEDRAAAVSR